MNVPNPNKPSRLARLSTLLSGDPENELLLAEVADAALAEGDFTQAEHFVNEGLRRQGPSAAWLFRQSRLRIAQRRLDDARTILQRLRQELPPTAGVDHDLAYVEFLQGDAAACERMLQPWVESSRAPDAFIETLWLRALHHQDKLKQAWDWIQERVAAQLQGSAAGVASLIAVDLGHMDAAGSLSLRALQSDPDQVEALVAGGSVALARNDLKRAQSMLEHAGDVHPHQARAWSALGYTELVGTRAAAARSHFEKALQLAPEDLVSLVGLGWACVMSNDSAGAARAFETAVKLDEEYSEAHGGLAVVSALGGAMDTAQQHAMRAQQLQPDSISARFAQAAGSRSAAAMQELQGLLRELLDSGILRDTGARHPDGREKG